MSLELKAFQDALLIRSVVARFVKADEEEPSKGGVPARWDEWLKAVHEGGREMAPNPNPATRDRYKEVTFSTALKDKGVFKKAIKEYHEWVKKNPEKDGPSKPKTKKQPEEPKEAPQESDALSPAENAEKPPLQKPLKVTPESLDVLIKKHKKNFDSATKAMKAAVADYENNYANMTTVLGDDIPSYAVTEFKALSEEEKMLHVAGHLIGKLFEESLSKEDLLTHKTFTRAWQDSSSNGTSQQLHGALSSLGVEGHQTEKDKEKEHYREAGKQKEWLKDYMGKAYAFSQAYYKHIGLKEVTLFRGVVGIDKAEDGEEVSIETRELSSFTSDPKIAAQFGRPLKMKVPVENILWSNVVAPTLGEKEPPGRGEGEIAVMGASKIPGKVIGRHDADQMMELDGR